MKQAITLTVSPRLRDVLPPLTDEQRQRLEQNIVDDGEITDPVCYWFDGTDNVIVDGMNRFDIAATHDMGYEIREMSFAGYDEVIVWMLERQAGRRNLTPHQLSEIRGKWYLAAKDKSPEARLPSGQIGHQGENIEKTAIPAKKTAEVIAEKTGVSEHTVRRDGKTQATIQAIPENIRGGMKDTLNQANQTDLDRFSKLDAGAQQTVARAVRVGQAKTLKDVLKTVPAPAGKPKPPVKALEGREAEAFDARRSISGMHKTIAQWFVPVDKIRDGFPGAVGDDVLKHMKAVYESLKKWEKVVK